MLAEKTSTKLQPIIKTILDLSPQEQFEIIVILLKSVFGIQKTETLIKNELTLSQKPQYVDKSLADFLPEDESIDDFLAFSIKQRQENLVL